MPLDGKRIPIIQRFKPECKLSRSVRERSGLKDSDLTGEKLYGVETKKWQKIFSQFDTLFVLKTGSGDEADWLEKVVLDHEENVKIIKVDRLVNVFLNNINDRSFSGLYEKFIKKQLKPNKDLMQETLVMVERMLREIIYIYSQKESSLNSYLVDLTRSVKDIPEFDAVYNLVKTCKDSGWLSDDLLAQPNDEHEQSELVMMNGWDILKDNLPVPIIRNPSDETEGEIESIEVSPGSVTSFFNSNFLKEHLPNYEKRPAQIDYSRVIANTFNEPVHNYIEAPTGIGKSLAYLLPACLFLEKNRHRKIIIATATKNLQSQIVEDDWPLIQKRFPNLKISLLKGKSNYLCTSALARNFSHCFGKDSIPAERAAWIILALFLNRTSGDLEKIPYLLKKWIEPLNAIIEDCRADLHCTDSLCKPSDCNYGKHLTNAEEADLIVTNHYKIAMMQEGIVGLSHAVVIDEAERFGDNVRKALSIQIELKDIKNLFYRFRGSPKRKGFIQVIDKVINKLEKGKGKKAKAAKETKDLINGLRGSIEFIDVTIPQAINDLIPQSGNIPSLMQHLPALRDSGDSLKQVMAPIINGLELISQTLADLQEEEVPLKKSFKQRCESYRVLVEVLQRKFSEFSEGFMTKNYAHHLKGDAESWSLVRIPMTIHKQLNESIYQYIGHVIFTSATIYVGKTPHHFMYDYGSYFINEEPSHSKFPNVFDYKKSVICAVDTSITPYNYNDHSQMTKYRNDVDRAICNYALAMNGRTLILFMSQIELNRSYERTSPFFKDHDILPIRQNGSSLEEIREFNRNEYSVLFGVDRFWSGVNFPGSTLSQVIIVKAPNPSLSDPYIAHQKLWDSNFFQTTYPIYGRLKLRQGFGRLMRSINDKGGVVILDSRYLYNPWFYQHLKELPMEVTMSDDQEFIMRSVLDKAGLKTEFNERRIDPFLNTSQFDLINQGSSSGFVALAPQKIQLKQ